MDTFGKEYHFKSFLNHSVSVLARILMQSKPLNISFKQDTVFQKQPSRGILSKRCSENMQQIFRRIPMLKCDFNKVAKQLY